MEKRLSNKEFYGLYRKYLPMFKKDHKGTLKLIRQDNSIPKADLDGLLNMLKDSDRETTLDFKRCKEKLKKEDELIKNKIKKQNRQEILDSTDLDSPKGKGNFEHEGDLSGIYDAYDEYQRDKLNYSVLTKRLQHINFSDKLHDIAKNAFLNVEFMEPDIMAIDLNDKYYLSVAPKYKEDLSGWRIGELDNGEYHGELPEYGNTFENLSIVEVAKQLAKELVKLKIDANKINKIVKLVTDVYKL